MFSKLLGLSKEPEVEHKTVVRITTSDWGNQRGVYSRRSMTYLRRKSSGHNTIEEDVSNMGGQGIIYRVINFYEVQDGVYEVIVTNIKRDWETNAVDDWDYMLVPYKE